jgi:hypothetical protein
MLDKLLPAYQALENAAETEVQPDAGGEPFGSN